MSDAAAEATLNRTLDEALAWGWGYSGLRPHQRQAIEAGLAGQDSLVILPTGGGKSICYQLPALVGKGATLVVSPLIALMEDQVQAARQAVSAAALHSEIPLAEQRRIVEDYKAGKIRLLYTSPERLARSDLMQDLIEHPPALVAIDEAHCISSWGHDFRPEYRQLADLLQTLPAPRMALTATATPKVADDIVAQLRLRDPLRVIAPMQRSNLILRSLPRQNRGPQIAALVESRRGQCGIIYCRKRSDTLEIAADLVAQGHSCAAFHAGLPAAQKKETLTAFLQDRLDVVVATVAFGMGIDRPDVRFVVHAAMPSSLEAYVQEAGRAGRDGALADCILLHSGDDLRTTKFFIDKENPSQERRDSLEKALWNMVDYARHPSCRHRQISEHFGQSLEGGGNCQKSCDVCLGELKTMPEVEAIAITSACLELINDLDPRRFGRGHIAAVLVGSKAAKILKWNHDKHRLHGALGGYAEKALMQLIDQLESQGYVFSGRSNGFPVLELGQTQLDSKHPPLLVLTPSKASKQRSTSSPQVALEQKDHSLFDVLKVWRREIASARGVPAYVIASDRSLKALASARPTSRSELHQIHGFGAVKVEALADEILPLIQAQAEF